MAADLTTTYDEALKREWSDYIAALGLGFNSVSAYRRWRDRLAAINSWHRTGVLFYID